MKQGRDLSFTAAGDWLLANSGKEARKAGELRGLHSQQLY